jgi:hypothetical protein
MISVIYSANSCSKLADLDLPCAIRCGFSRLGSRVAIAFWAEELDIGRIFSDFDGRSMFPYARAVPRYIFEADALHHMLCVGTRHIDGSRSLSRGAAGQGYIFEEDVLHVFARSFSAPIRLCLNHWPDLN